jgi:hypothetical protein
MKERLTKMMADKKGQYIIAGVIVLLGFLVFHLVASEPKGKEEGIDLTLDKETSVPLASIDSTQLNKSRLELQQEALKSESDEPDNVASSFDFSNWKSAQENPSEQTNKQEQSSDIASRLDVPSRNIQSNPMYYQQESESQRLQELEKIKADEKRKLLLALLELKKQNSSKQKTDDFVEIEKLSESEKSGVINSITPNEVKSGGVGFHGLASQEKEKMINAGFEKEFANIRAVIHAQSTIINGGRIQLRLLEPISIKGKIVPKGSLLYGLAGFGTERVKIAISSLIVDGMIIPVKMAVYDMDGMEGIFVPNIMSLDAIKQSSNQAIQGINMPVSGLASNVGTAVGLSALSATTQGIKGLAGKKLLTQKATLKSNYFIFIKNVKQ